MGRGLQRARVEWVKSQFGGSQRKPPADKCPMVLWVGVVLVCLVFIIFIF